jgi:urease accessory protein
MLLFVALGPESRNSLMAGLTDPVRGLDHFLALLAVGIWAGRLRSPDLWALPAAFLAGMAPGFVLAFDQVPIPIADALIHLVILGSLLSFVTAVLVPIRLPTMEAARTVAMIGGCHGYDAWLGGGLSVGGVVRLGALLAAAVLLAAGVCGRTGCTADVISAPPSQASLVERSSGWTRRAYAALQTVALGAQLKPTGSR